MRWERKLSMQKYIELNRTFWPVPDDATFDPDTLRIEAMYGAKTTGWLELLEQSRVVILAEAGTGKTDEFKATARKLRAEGRAAFFFAIEDLADVGIDEAISVGNIGEFQEWLTSDQHGWFFLDSVDEARIVNYTYFERALKRIARALGGKTRQAHTYISARVSEWNATADLALVEEILPLPSEEEKRNDTLSVEYPDNSQEIFEDENKGMSLKSKIHIVQLAPLNDDQIRLFSAGQGVRSITTFMDALDKADAKIFAERPQDLLDLISYWEKHHKIGSHAEMIAYNIQKKLSEQNHKHESKYPLSPDTALQGAEILAGALTLSRMNTVVLPDQPVDPLRSAQSIDAKELLPDWNTNDVRGLLDRALFDEATYGRVRIHHRSVREYLTAKWLYQQLDKGYKSRRAIDSLIFVNRYGMEVVVPSMQPIAAWLALWDERLCQRLSTIAPEVLIGYGDPSRLSVEMRENMLRRFAEIHENRKHVDESFDLASIRRLADPKLSKVVCELLKQYRNSADIRKLLLRMVWQGEMKECIEAALTFALDATMDTYTRIGGIRAIASAGDKSQRRRVVDMLTSELDSQLIGEICGLFFPEFVSIDTLLNIVETIKPPKRFSTSPLAHALEKITEESCPKDWRLPLLAGFADFLERKPHVEGNYCDISKRYTWLLKHASELAFSILVDNSKILSEEAVLRTIELSYQGKHYQIGYHGDNDKFVEFIASRPELRYAFFWRSVAQKRSQLAKKDKRLDDWWEVRFMHAPWTLSPEDFDYFLEQTRTFSDIDNRLVSLSVAFSLWQSSGKTKQGRERLKKVVKCEAELENRLHQYLHQPPMSKEYKKSRREDRAFKVQMAKRDEQEKNDRIAWITRLKSNPDFLRKIDKANVKVVFHDLHYIGRNISRSADSSSKWASSQWKVLIPEFGQEVAEAARDGFMAFWRFYKPDLESARKDNSIPGELVAGLIGLEIEALEHPDWLNHFSEEEARLVARYATREMNGFPSWIIKFLHAYPEALDYTVRHELVWEFQLSAKSVPPHHMLADLRNGPEVLRTHYSPNIMELLETYEPFHFQTLENSLHILLQWAELNDAKFASLAKTRCSKIKSENCFLTWLAVWMYVDADQALHHLRRWLSKARKHTDKDQRIVKFCGALTYHHNLRFGGIRRDFERIEVLRQLVPFIYNHVRIDDDVSHDGVYTPGARDNAETTRGYLLEKVCNTPGKAAFDTLMEFSRILPHEWSRDRMLTLAKRRASADAEQEPWQTADVVSFALEAEKTPHTVRELFEIACNRLDDIKLDLEDGDYSEASILRRAELETEARNWLANRLRTAAHGKYTVSPEEELADSTRPDLRIHAQVIDTPVVIELKLADKESWTITSLRERLRNQLVGQYMRDIRSTYGIFLLIMRKTKRWKTPATNQMISFDVLVELLNSEAKIIMEDLHDLLEIKIIGIDLTKRDNRLVQSAETP